MSYTTFKYAALKLDKSELAIGDNLTVSVKVTNTGNRPGKEIVQLFVSDIVASITPPVKSLKRFDKVDLKPGGSETVTFELNTTDLAFIGIDNKPVVEPGRFKLAIADLSKMFEVR